MSELDLERDEGQGSFGFVGQLHRVLWQRKLLILVPFILLSMAGVAAAMLLPATYRSSATLLVESQALPRDIVSSPVTTIVDQRIARIRQQILSRGDLIGLIQQYDLYTDERRESPLSEVVQRMREDIAVTAIASDGGRRGETSTIAFTVSFDYEQPSKAQLVTQSLVERILEIDASQLSEQAQNTVQFLSQQAEGLQSQIVELENRITSMKAQNGLVLSTNGLSPVSSSATYDAQISALRRENGMIRRNGAAREESEDPLVSAAEAQLALVRARYAESHPDIALAQRRLEEARRLAETRRQARPDTSAEIEAQIAANNAQIAALERARDQDAGRTNQLMAAQARAPAVVEEISQLEARAIGLREQQREVSTRLLSAQGSARMETEQMGERLSVTDPAAVPDSPISPDRPLLMVGGIAGGLVLGLLLALAVELIQRPIRGVRDLEAATGLAPLAVIPTMEKGTAKRRAGRFALFRGRRKQAKKEKRKWTAT